MTHRGTTVALALVAGIALLQCAAGPSPEGRRKALRSGKLASVLYELATASDRAGFAVSRRIPLAEGRVRVFIYMSASATDPDRKRLVERHGMIVEKTADGSMRVLVPVDALIPVSRDAAVSFVDLPDRPGT